MTRIYILISGCSLNQIGEQEFASASEAVVAARTKVCPECKIPGHVSAVSIQALTEPVELLFPASFRPGHAPQGGWCI